MATEVVYRETRRRYHWPEVQLNLWILIILAAAATDLGIFAWFITVQQQMKIGIPWYAFIQIPSVTLKLTTFLSQALHIHHRHRLPNSTLPPPDPHPRLPPPTHPRHHPPGQLHPLRAVADRPHRNRHPTLRRRQRQRQLPALRLEPGVRRRQRGDAGVADAEQHLQLLEGGVRVRGRRRGALLLDVYT